MIPTPRHRSDPRSYPERLHLIVFGKRPPALLTEQSSQHLGRIEPSATISKSWERGLETATGTGTGGARRLRPTFSEVESGWKRHACSLAGSRDPQALMRRIRIRRQCRMFPICPWCAGFTITVQRLCAVRLATGEEGVQACHTAEATPLS